MLRIDDHVVDRPAFVREQQEANANQVVRQRRTYAGAS